MKKIVRNIKNRLWDKIKTTDAYKTYWNGITKFWEIKTFDYDVVNLGSTSGVNAFCYENLPIKGMNWALGPQSLEHDFSILKNYFSYLRSGAVVFIPICPFSCLISNYTKEQNYKYYTILHPATIKDFDDAERRKAYLKKLNSKKEILFSVIKTPFREIRTLFHKRTDFNKNASSWVENWKKQFEISDLGAPLQKRHKEEQQLRAILLKEIILFCKERDLKPMVVLPPMHPSLTNLFSQEFKQMYIYDFVSMALQEDDTFLDYMNDKNFQKDDFFRNSYLMNKKGASAFTQKILKELRLI